eukprot:CAMPEP_0206297576 /NCGR_PEP_ID=MMETSP0106_2-20121207/6242_1 /ASSEMBLY_ACC=CAM_ASM_000206 /TAXON_ID=81532 /ORGANISM="Acanthoeca-like sp., Strain 10tr" /LENGTH=153 /DNA_ID=CAMNT_0053728243 /DNA_START=554 /DNA_END=1016 /DNA_ORIENTATION=-
MAAERPHFIPQRKRFDRHHPRGSVLRRHQSHTADRLTRWQGPLVWERRCQADCHLLPVEREAAHFVLIGKRRNPVKVVSPVDNHRAIVKLAVTRRAERTQSRFMSATFSSLSCVLLVYERPVTEDGAVGVELAHVAQVCHNGKSCIKSVAREV